MNTVSPETIEQHRRDLANFEALTDFMGGVLAACDVLGVSYESVKMWKRGPACRTGRAFPAYVRRSILAHLALAGEAPAYDPFSGRAA